MPNPYDKTTYDGKCVDWLTRAALEATAKRLGYDLTIVQGSYNRGGVVPSAGTHDGGGVVDLLPWHYAEKVLEMRRTGFAAWHRLRISGLWEEHIHAVLIGNHRLSDAAADQVDDYLAGRNGLANNGPDDGPRNFVHNRFRFPESLLPPISLVKTVEQYQAGVEGRKLTESDDVNKTQRCLNARYGADLLVDGIAGPVTRAAYRRHELAITGGEAPAEIPDKGSLSNLVRDRYRLAS